MTAIQSMKMIRKQLPNTGISPTNTTLSRLRDVTMTAWAGGVEPEAKYRITVS